MTSSAATMTSAGQMVGSANYAAPEQIEARSVRAGADIYSLGCVLYECLTGAKPFPLETDVAVMYAHMLEPPPKVTDHKPDLPAGLDDVVARAMAKAEEEEALPVYAAKPRKMRVIRIPRKRIC